MEVTDYVTIGKYITGESPVHRQDLRSKIAAVTVLTVAVFVVRDFSGSGLLTLFLLGVVLASQIPLGYLLRGLRPVLFLLLMTLVLNVFFSGLQGGPVLFQLGRGVATRGAAFGHAPIGSPRVARR